MGKRSAHRSIPAHKETGAPLKINDKNLIHLQLESSQPSAHRGERKKSPAGAALPKEVIHNELAILDAELRETRPPGPGHGNSPDNETSNHETDWLFLPILCPILLLGQGPEGISKKNLANANLSLMDNHDPAEKEVSISSRV